MVNRYNSRMMPRMAWNGSPPLVRLFWVGLLSGLLLITSCASKPRTVTARIPAVPPLGVAPLPLRAALVLPESFRGTVHREDISCFLQTAPFLVQTGATFERGAVQAFSQAFSKVELLRERPTPDQPYDLIIEFPPPELNLDADCGLPFTRPTIQAKAFLHVKATGRRDEILLNNTYSSGLQSAERVSDAAGKALTDLLNVVAAGFTSATKIRSYARALEQGTSTRASAVPGGSSDVGLTVSGIGVAVGFDYIVTPYHLVAGMSQLAVGYQEKLVPATLVLRDRLSDIALLKLQDHDSQGTLTGLRLSDVGQVKEGDRVWALELTRVSRTGENGLLTEGTVTSLTSPDGDSRFLQLSLSIPPRQTGAPLLNGRGEVIGIVLTPRDSAYLLGLTQGAPDLQLAIKVQFAKALLALLPESEYIAPSPATRTMSPAAMMEMGVPQLVFIHAGR